ncbi:glycosyltransferase family 2 protein [Clostridium sp. FP1]|uniref:glycosyltransferase family 2 protein n=1 Tax=Clostridium sp. FP1 TaxID=2724076 RepID=UPI0013E96406|nr:glycosyltransferase family 2 protein [Clostridium sp. FP1]MBZ9636623.1 glycosyltransferase family 2 protein [Clostridium sp. FP1]
MHEKKRITVFTPTYNRAYILNRLYESLKRQTNDSFLWLIVDDGSTDNTEELVNTWLSEELIEVRYCKQKNGGKQRAHNKGVELCDTELFICVDSDDYVTEDAIESFISTWDSIKNKQKISGIVALRGKDSDTPMGTWMPQNVEISPLTDLCDRYGFRGDTALLFRTDILKQFLFFVVQGEKFIGESYVYLQIDQHYSLYLLDRILYICEYLEDGYTANVRSLTKNNPRGYMVLNRQSAAFSKSIKSKYLNSIRYMVGCILSKEKHKIKNAPYKNFAVLAYPPAILLYILRYR